MEEKILEALNQKYPGVDAKTLGRIAKTLAKTVTTEADVKTAVDGVTFKQVMDNYGDARATEATNTAIKNYEDKHKLKDGKPVEEPKDPKDPKDPKEPKDPKDMPEWAKQMQEELKANREALAEYKAKESGAARKAKLDELLKDAPESVRKMYEGSYQNMTFENDEKFDAWLGETKPIVEGMVKELKTKGAVVRTPMQKTERKEGEADPRVLERAEKAAAAAKSAPSVIMGGLPTQTQQ